MKQRRGRLGIDGHKNDASGETRPQRGDPTGPALRPQHRQVAFADALGVEARSQLIGHARDFGIAIRTAAIAVIIDDEFCVEPRGAVEIFDELAGRGMGRGGLLGLW